MGIAFPGNPSVTTRPDDRATQIRSIMPVSLPKHSFLPSLGMCGCEEARNK